ncbi:alpha/beta hydrolase [Sinomonas susongensis]|uniref:alpha/beta hydrolase n=1 Tax=Sinomonas susongensis TaxID=1324851 RepID=UPI0011091C0E|nr:alpha/beta hydrolase-fold protein [Sinomonas susongensis]
MGPLSGLDLTQGPLTGAVTALAAAAVVYLLARRWRRGFLIPVLTVVVACLTACAAGWWATESGLSTHPLPADVLAWIGVATLGILFAAAGIAAGPWRRRLLSPIAAAVVLAAAALQANAYYGQYRTLADLIGASTADIPSLATVSGTPTAASVPLGQRQESSAVSAHGQVFSSGIPGVPSGFAGRPAYIYLPPAYSAPSHAPLPVLVLVSGQPGSPADWLTGGRIRTILDGFAASHHGLAPVTVVPDVNGAATANTMCMDSRIARADTYLSADVPVWIRSTLDVSSEPTRWAIGGFSFGGTCAIQMATLHPGTYGTALDFSGEGEPALGPSRAATVQTAFGGDTKAFEALTPLHQLQAHRYPHSWAYFAAGAADAEFTASMHEVAAAARRAGMTTQATAIPSTGHSWAVPATALPSALDWVAARLGLAP